VVEPTSNSGGEGEVAAAIVCEMSSNAPASMQIQQRKVVINVSGWLCDRP
jgi:hypothetical protein